MVSVSITVLCRIMVIRRPDVILCWRWCKWHILSRFDDCHRELHVIDINIIRSSCCIYMETSRNLLLRIKRRITIICQPSKKRVCIYAPTINGTFCFVFSTLCACVCVFVCMYVKVDYVLTFFLKFECIFSPSLSIIIILKEHKYWNDGNYTLMGKIVW